MSGTLLAPGSRLGQYRVEAFLARGASGEVYRAADEHLGRRVALKVLPPWMSEEPRVRDRFLAEARSAASLDHPNVLPVYDAGDADGTLWIAMRLADGPDLRELLRRGGPLAPERAVRILSGIAAALDAAHARGILHRDVKPANILLGADPASDHAYLADFGLATAAHGHGLTRTGELLGTIDYVSPEQARGEPLDARSDTWSLAAVLYECLTGSPPFRRDSELAALTARVEAPAPPPSSLRPDLPAALDTVFARGLARDPAARYPSAGAFMAGATAAVRGAQLRGLLFADLRGYTDFAEREGDDRAGALLARYRSLVRSAVARIGGAEVRTEGDSFYVVFPSATLAIRAGLAIVAAAAAATAQDATLPLRPGIGVHAGEPLEAPEGPVGGAVNTAARLCGLAAPGEVLVSTTARDLAAGSRGLAFSARGPLPAKGLAEPIEAWAASTAGPGTAGVPANEAAAGGTRLPRRSTPAASLVVGAAAVLLVAVGIAAILSRPTVPSPASPDAGAAGASASTPAAPPGGSPSPSSASTPRGPLASTTVGSFPDQSEAAILGALPAALAGTCFRGRGSDDARLAGFAGSLAPIGSITPSGPSIECSPATGPRRAYVMAPALPPEWKGDPTASAEVYLGYLAGAHELPPGSCATASRAYERWSGPRGTGLLACMNPYDGRPWIYFTFGGGRFLGFATRDDSSYSSLYAWWEQLRTFLP